MIKKTLFRSSIIEATKAFCFVFALFSYSALSVAEQSHFSKQLIDSKFHFSYQWFDYKNEQQSISFSLPKQEIFDRYRDFSIYQTKLAQEYVNKSLKKHFKKAPVQGVQIVFNEENGIFQAELKSTDEQLLQNTAKKISQLEQTFNQEYLTKKYYHQFVTPSQTNAIKPDHGRIALESVPDLKSLKTIILEKSSIKNIRKVSNYVLGFVQNIPYSTLESRITSSGAGFSPPLKLLWENQGDCDSKVTLTATLLRVLMPRIKLALIYIENHAFIGIKVAPKDDDITVEHNGITYVLAEPTGPAVLALGKISEESEQAIYSGHYSLETFHDTIKSEENEPDFDQDEDEIIDQEEDESQNLAF
ncbi:hypothetical protein Q4493_16235 [Colwellia sp. 1_MG-2023]|uniref:hypothetical protein n=1 Tax=Colwellia sp. 1_MG-2023 TaxID=3062649 RepID=UPI0026E3F786|nr:hypothetical protein [Colwellia sp. 1_MG-2023]MDO6447320.1 hypothetical protein [Colwellia sp. 1_MG-2023]